MIEKDVRNREIKQIVKRIGTGSRSRKYIFAPQLCRLLAYFGICGGLASLFVGIVFVLVHSLAINDRMFDRIGTGLLIVAIPMVLVGSIFLDEIELRK